MSGELSKKYVSELINFDDIPLFQSPLYWADDNRLGFSGSPKFGNWITRSILLEYVLFDVVAGVGEYDLSAFPEEISGDHELKKTLMNSVHANLTESNL
jgi:hypothetical protein